MVAVDFLSDFIDEHTAIAIAIESNTEVEFFGGDEALQRMKVGAATFFVNFSIVAFVGVDEVDFGAELFEDSFADDAGGTVGAVETDVKTFEIANADIIAEVFEVEFESFVMEIFAEAGRDGGVGLGRFKGFFDGSTAFFA